MEYPVVYTITMGFNSSLPLWKLKNCLWNLKIDSLVDIDISPIQVKYHFRASRVCEKGLC